jgi:hypothetical protein
MPRRKANWLKVVLAVPGIDLGNELLGFDL